MADLPGGFWSGWIVVLTLVSLAGLSWLTLSVYFSAAADKESKTEPVWDNDLKEGNTAPPMWWFWMLFAALIFSLIYLMLFPGLGSFSGLLNWSQGSRVARSYENYDMNFAEIRAEIAASSLAEIQNDLRLMDTAERIFRRECSACHGPDGRGQAALFPNLMDIDWQWGSTPQQIEQSIRGGRQGNMIAWTAVLSEEGIEQVANYVVQMGQPVSESHAGKAAYDQNCTACHGVDGEGNPMLGGPRLADDIWLYGGDIETVRETLTSGRVGVMPRFRDRLDDMQIKLLVALLAR
ncbi:MAG: cytochrome-c oxidase, cbb3-type subunit III [Proteobacteria bacterium]|nr:cytochrome-c oxidase, cbb3-type subunit III [Pseudomonadota bacterium]